MAGKGALTSLPGRAWPAAFWPHVRHELLYLSWAVMETALITPLSLVVMGFARYWPPQLVLAWLLGVMLTAFNMLRLLALLRLSPGRRQLVMVLALLLTVLVSSSTLLYHARSPLDLRWIPAFFRHIARRGNLLWVRDVTVVLLTVVLWTRGTALQQREFGIRGAGLFLRFGGLILAPLLIWLAGRRLTWSVAPFLMLFLASGMTAVALIRAEQIERLKSGFAAFLSPGWLSRVLLAVGTVILAAALLAGLTSGRGLPVLVAWLEPLWRALTFGGAIALATAALFLLPVLARLTGLVQWLVTRLADRFGYQGPAPDAPPYSTDPVLTLQDLTTVAGNLSWPARVLILLGLLLIGLFVIWTVSAVSRRLRLGSPALAPSGGGAEPAAGERWGRRIRRRLRGWRRWQMARSIRYVYREMGALAGAAGFARGAAQTPYEYLATLEQAWPDHGADVRLITEAYVRIRYGELPETETEMDAIWAAWRRLVDAPPAATTPHKGSEMKVARRGHPE